MAWAVGEEAVEEVVGATCPCLRGGFLRYRFHHRRHTLRRPAQGPTPRFGLRALALLIASYPP
ncbi:MAG: hypothetical protein Hens2KO_15140 [Henriciella sp.]